MTIQSEKNQNDIQHVFIVGCKGIPANYGGFETFVDKLTQHQSSDKIKYHVACGVDKLEGEREFAYHKAHCFNIKWKNLGSAKAIFYDIDSLKWIMRYIKKHNIQHPIVYVLACRIGPFIAKYAKQIRKYGGQLFVNPDGHEWKREKWSAPVRSYWKYSERLMVKSADLLICDSKNIQSYIEREYAKYSPKTSFIAYGAEMTKSSLANDDKQFLDWMNTHNLKPKEYYLVVGRFVPENNFETMIREFMASKTEKTFALITNVSEKFLEDLKAKTNFTQDKRINFVGTVYDQELLKKIREQAYGYFHGHEVGGTNPSLLEALASTDINLLLDVGFNREVAEDGALYWSKNKGDLAGLIEKTDNLNDDEIIALSTKAKNRIRDYYSWAYIESEYRKVFEWQR